MSDHAAHAHGGHEDVVSAPFLANLGFTLGIIGVILTATIKLSPVGFLCGIGAVVFSLLGLGQGIVQGRYLRGAIAGLFCGALVILFWMVVRNDITSVAGGRDAWPSWML